MRTATVIGCLVAGWVALAGAQANDPSVVNRTAEIYYFSNTATTTVDSVTLDFFPASGGVLSDPRKEGKQFVRVAVTVTNTGDEEFPVNYTNFYLQTSDGTRHSTTSSINKGNSDDRMETTKLAPGGSTSGALYYEVGADESLETLTFVFTGRRGTDHKDTLIRLGSDDTADLAD